jgi:diaminohydroxyphosphoribosylaminopyrimidine deaminase/5-amino-6-(5-phosphoribosylamino)uracil reductase
MTNDARWMARALALARRGEGFTRPNPPVGAVVVRRGRVLGEGWHRRAGLPHAEVEALAACGGRAAGATLYVTLEPCSTHGRTPPCTDLLVRSGLRRVVAGCTDPDPRHAGRAFRLLRKAGLDVTVGVRGDECLRLIEPFAARLQRGRPFVTLKLALTLDGRIADRTRASRWITGPASRARVQALRRRADAILVGAGTVCADDPRLHCRLRGAPSAWRVVLDGRGRTPAHARILTDPCADTTLLVTSPRCPAAVRRRWAANGSRVWVLPAAGGARVNVGTLLRRLAGEGILHVLCEGGGEVAGQLLRAGLVDELVLFYAPALLGDAPARPAVAGVDFLLRRMPRFRIVEVTRVGDDVLVCARPVQAANGGRSRRA